MLAEKFDGMFGGGESDAATLFKIGSPLSLPQSKNFPFCHALRKAGICEGTSNRVERSGKKERRWAEAEYAVLVLNLQKGRF